MDISVWLESIGLEEYAPAFTENDISISLLPDQEEQTKWYKKLFS